MQKQNKAKHGKHTLKKNLKKNEMSIDCDIENNRRQP